MTESRRPVAVSGPKKAANGKPQAPARPDAVLQRRGVERVQAILDAAEQILAEEGYAAATLKAIGERAGIPTASVYHYFSDRDQVDIEIMNRHLRDLYGHLSDTLDDDRWTTIADAVDAVIIPMIAYFRAHPSAVELWFCGRSEALSSMVSSFDEESAEQLWRLLIDRGLLRDDTPLLALQVAFEAGNSLFDLAFRRTPGSGDDAVLDETRRLASAYLESYAPSRGRRKK